MKVRSTARGRPLIALVLLLVLWIGGRALLWNVSAFAPIAVSAPNPGSPIKAAAPLRPVAAKPVEWRFAPPLRGSTVSRVQLVPRRARPALAAPARTARPRIGADPLVRLGEIPLGRPVPPQAAAPFYAAARNPEGPRRWTGDGWLLLRRGGSALAAGGAPATYGASQMGAVLRYRLAPGDGHRPTAYFRATAALNGSGEKEAALGLSARPLPDIPVTAAAELRANRNPRGARLRPAVMVVTELPPIALPYGITGEAYGQAGYVGGRFATPFVDGQLRAERKVAAIGGAQLRAGAGAWGGAQKGASRFDVGPVATVTVGLGGNASARLAVDWRFRVGGNAAPSSGPALTLSAGF